MRTWCVYMHENRTDGKKYIGITGQRPEKRWRNGAGYANNAHFARAIARDGWDNFRHEILYTGLTKPEAESLEVELIAKYRTQDPAKGYNLAPGGFAPSASASTRRKMARAQRALWATAEHREKMSAARMGHIVSETTRKKIRAANMRHPVSEAARQRMSASHADVSGAKNPRARAVVCLTTGKVYATAAEAAKDCGTYKSDIAKCCKGTAKTAGGYRWSYYEEDTRSLSDSAS